MMISFRSSLATVTACGLLFSAAAALAGPKDYQITGDVVSINDTTIAIQKGKTAPWEIGRDAGTKAADGLKVGDHVTVHYTMTAATIDMNGTGAAAPKDKKAGGKDKASKKAAAEPLSGDATSKPAAEATSPKP